MGHFFECGHSLEYLWNLPKTQQELLKEYMIYKNELYQQQPTKCQQGGG